MILTRVDCTSCQPSPLRDLQGGCLPTLGLESPFVKRCCRAWEQHQMRFPGSFFPSVNTTQASILQNLGGSDGTGGGNASQLSTRGLAHSRYSADFAALHSRTSTALEGKGPELWFFCSVISISQTLSTCLSSHSSKQQKCKHRHSDLWPPRGHLLWSWMPGEKQWEQSVGGGILGKYWRHSRLIFLPGAKLS